MIEYTIGVPGSGKTYRAMYALYSNFGLNNKLKDKKFIHDDIEFAYTNINEIKIDNFQKDKIKKLDWDLFKQHLTQLHSLYKSKMEDSELIKVAKDLNLANCLIILDECHNYLDTNDKVLVWWLSYHRHLHQQIYLITQNLALVNTKYKAFSEFFYKAFPSSLRFFSSKMKYAQYTNSRMAQNSKSGIIKIPFQKEIYDCYHSGANQQSENLLKKFGLLAVLLFAFLIFIIMMIQSYWAPDIKKENKLINSNIVNAQIKKQQTIITINNNEQIFTYKPYIIYCNNQICIINNKLYTYKYINFLKKHFKLKIIKLSDIKNFDFNEYHLFISSENYNKLFVRSIANENNTKNTILPKLF